jgi:hypothetical protein
MTKPVLKTLSFAFVAFGAASASAAEQGPMLHLATLPAALGASCTAQVEIERGWEAQQRLLDERLAAKGLAMEIPGTIISPPLPDFGATRADARVQAARPAGRAGAVSANDGR